MARQDERTGRAGQSRERSPARPVFDCRHGMVKAAVWENAGKKGPFPTVTFSRLYKDKGEKWQTASSFNVWDLADLARCAFAAEAYCRVNYGPEDDDERRHDAAE